VIRGPEDRHRQAAREARIHHPPRRWGL